MLGSPSFSPTLWNGLLEQVEISSALKKNLSLAPLR